MVIDTFRKEENMQEQPNKLLRMSQVCEATGLSASSVRRYVERGDFPKGRRLSSRLTVWAEREVMAWLEKDFGTTQ